MKFLLVDDEADFGPYAQVLLRKIFPDSEVIQVRNCDEAKQRAQTESFDLVLMDQVLPASTGVECLRHLRETVPDLPVVMLTCASHDYTAVDEAMAAGADDYVLKENMTAILPHVVWAAVERRRTRRRIDKETEGRVQQLLTIKKMLADQRSAGVEQGTDRSRESGQAH